MKLNMNFYFDAAKILDRLDAKQGSIKGIISTFPERGRKRTTALIIETLKCMFPALLPAQMNTRTYSDRQDCLDGSHSEITIAQARTEN